jgi:TMEM175 potassium channel family protein
MTTFYNQIAGQSLHRLAALCDGVFAIAMTLLVLNLAVPAREAIHSDADLWMALIALGPHLLTYLMSFLTLGIFWVGQQTAYELLAKSDRAYSWINLAFLLMVTLVPFSTALLAAFIRFRLALVIYWLNILMIGLLLLHAWNHARKFHLRKAEVPEHIHRALWRRIVVGQSLYAMGAALCVFSTWWSIGFIMAVQIQYAIAPRFKPFTWL